MRISDWSSDVCSSDLLIPLQKNAASPSTTRPGVSDRPYFFPVRQYVCSTASNTCVFDTHNPSVTTASTNLQAVTVYSPDERRVGKACVRTCRSGWSPYHTKKQQKDIEET